MVLLLKQSLIFICVFVTTFILINDKAKPVSAAAAVESDFSKRWEKYDIDRILASRRLLDTYLKCILDKGPCTSEGKDVKAIVPEVLKSECANCSEIQKRQVGKILSHLLQNRRDVWDELVAKYDPEGVIRKKYKIEQDLEEDYGEDEES